MSRADSHRAYDHVPEHHCQLFDMLLKIYEKEVHIVMEEKIKQNSTQTAPAKPCRTKIIIERHYGEGNLLDLFSDYVAGKIQSHIKETTKLKDEITA